MTPDPLLEACARALYEAHPLFGLGGLVSWGYLASSEQAERIEAAAAVIAVCRPAIIEEAAALLDSRAMMYADRCHRGGVGETLAACDGYAQAAMEMAARQVRSLIPAADKAKDNP